MNTSELFKTFEKNPTKKLQFILPDGREVKGDLHFTEVKSVTVKSVDCGSNAHSFNETIIQLWLNERSGKEAEWLGSKAINILDKVGSAQHLDPDSEVYFEYGDSLSQTAKYSIDSVNYEKEDLLIQLYVKPTECKPSRNKALACC